MPELSAKVSPEDKKLHVQIRMDGGVADLLLLLTSLVNSVSRRAHMTVPEVCAVVAMTARDEAAAREDETVIDLSFLKNRGDK